jgi:hypothetical protein
MQTWNLQRMQEWTGDALFRSLPPSPRFLASQVSGFKFPKVRWREGKALGSEEGNALGRALRHEQKKRSWVRVSLRLTEITNQRWEDGFSDKRI